MSLRGSLPGDKREQSWRSRLENGTRRCARGVVAQLVEQRTLNPKRVGSNPTGPTSDSDYFDMFIILAVQLHDDSARIERVWWRRAESNNSWRGEAQEVDASDVANAIAVGHKVFARINRHGHWIVRQNVVANVDADSRQSIHLDGAPDEVDEAFTWLAENWQLREI
jgi:hypothetical protein